MPPGGTAVGQIGGTEGTIPTKKLTTHLAQIIIIHITFIGPGIAGFLGRAQIQRQANDTKIIPNQFMGINHTGKTHMASRQTINGNRFKGSSDCEISLWNECARLLTNAFICFNSTILSRLLSHFERTGDDKRLTITKQVSPVVWHNIKLNGIYSFNFDQNLIDIEEITRSIPENEGAS